MQEEQIASQIERLLDYAEYHRLLDSYDRMETRNALLDLYGLSEPDAEVLESSGIHQAAGRRKEAPPLADILEPLVTAAAEKGLIADNTPIYRDLMDARLMGLVMPRSSEVVRRFSNTSGDYGIKRATDEYYAMSIASNYIRMDRIRLNEYWTASTPFGELEITINLSKPEKDPKDIAAERAAPQGNYPKCLLCLENVGYAGRVNHPARQNHKVIPLVLNREQWYFQYSPYVYYNEHSIIFKGTHSPMAITEETFGRLLDFVEQFPHYFIGSNADLPIVGGSILSHDHFQGGRHRFAMEKAGVISRFESEQYPNVQAGIVHWPMSVIRLQGESRDELVSCASRVLSGWRAYSDEQCGILAYTENAGERVPHNTITPIARVNADGRYELDLVLRNNRCTEEHPDGLFHPHRELHHIKKENIGLIEVMGLAVLPGRLSRELEQVCAMLTGQTAMPDIMQAGHPLEKHWPWIERLVKQYGASLQAEEARKIVRQEVGEIYNKVLSHAGVYKQDPQGQAGFTRFLQNIGFQNT
ncbi:UDP-glucose--hexose-1-phosphate uridylyltransferase [Paenibacillus turpanensis]|uniref:UDP-glucose--hexose-1-phosphate uridylyltransferase n=1 Tax=Paenibacillus turpanensis TaxID=2689078 RepID=UPI00140CEB86|nr:UDP-glucose--hexose-1-phosphate uridylyltransferase [Paenibacillus turpanensis]